MANRVRFSALPFVGMLVLSMASVTHRAQAEPTAADRETARALMDRGYVQLKKGDTREALEAFKGADAIMGVPSTGLAVGLALEKLGRLVEARDKLLEVARLPIQPKESTQLRDARKQAETLQASLAERIPTLTLTVSGLAGGVRPTVRVDGAEVPANLLELPRKLDPGTHAIAGTAPGYRDVTTEVVLAEREQKSISLAFVPKPVESPKPVAPVPSRAIPSSSRVVAQEAGAGPRWLRSPLFWTGVGLAGAGAIAGSITGVLSLEAAADAKARCPNDVCPNAEPLETADRSQLLAHVSTGSFALAGVGAALAVVGVVIAPSTPSSPSPRASLVMGPASFGVVGEF
jgi:hypothetical protein